MPRKRLQVLGVDLGAFQKDNRISCCIPPAAGKDGEATNPLVLAFNARDAARGAAEMRFRKALAAGELRTNQGQAAGIGRSLT
jgi:hypothetical protein